MPELTITPDHIYHYGSKQLDGVTSIIRAEGFMPSSEFIDEWYMQRGSMVHLATALYDLGTLDESTIDDRIKGYLESWKKYREHTGIVYQKHEIEMMLCDTIYDFAGTLDRPDLDQKSGSFEPWHILQIGAYRRLWKSKNLTVNGGPDKTVYLDAEGGFPKVVKYDTLKLRQAENTFLCALNVHRAKKEMRLI